MDVDQKKTVLRMIPYGIYVLTTKDAHGMIAASTVNWVTQTSFDPLLVAAALKADSGSYAALRHSRVFALNMLGKDQQGAAFAFFKPPEVSDGKLSGEPYRIGETGAAIIESAIACAEFNVVEIMERGDHHVVIGEAVAVHGGGMIEGRPDEAGLHMKDLGEKVFYGG